MNRNHLLLVAGIILISAAIFLWMTVPPILFLLAGACLMVGLLPIALGALAVYMIIPRGPRRLLLLIAIVLIGLSWALPTFAWLTSLVAIMCIVGAIFLSMCN